MARRRRGLPAGLRPEAFTPRMDPAIRADPVARAAPGRADPVAPVELRADTVARADPRRVDPAAPADPRRADTVAPADPADPAARVDLRAHPADLADRVTQVDLREHPADHGTGMRSVATSAGRPGETEPHLGDRVHHRGLTGAGRSHHPGGGG